MCVKTNQIGEQPVMETEHTFCKYCRNPLESKLEHNQGYHTSCHQEVISYKHEIPLLDPQILEQLQLCDQDKTLVERLGEKLGVSFQATTEFSFSLTSTNHQFKLDFYYHFHNGSNILSSILYIVDETILYKFSVNFDFNIIGTKFSLRDFQKDEIDIDTETYERLYILLDELMWRKLKKTLSENDFDYIEQIKEIVNLPFLGMDSKNIYISKSETVKRTFNPYIRIQLDDQSNIVGITAIHFNQSIMEQFLSIKKSYLFNLTLYIEEVSNPESLFQNFVNFNQITELFLNLTYLQSTKWIEHYIVNYTSLKHLKLKKFALWFDCIMGKNGSLINFPKKISLELLSLQSVILPDLVHSNVKSLIYNIFYLNDQKVSLDKIPINLQELELNFSLIADEIKFICSKENKQVKKLVFNETVSKEQIMRDEEKIKEIKNYFPNAQIEFQKDSSLLSFFPIFHKSYAREFYSGKKIYIF